MRRLRNWLGRWFISRKAYEWCWAENDRLKNELGQLNDAYRLNCISYDACQKTLDEVGQERDGYLDALTTLRGSSGYRKADLVNLTVERDNARRELAKLRTQHNLLVHAVNDAAMLANE